MCTQEDKTKKEEKERTRKESNNVLRSFRGRGKGVGGGKREKKCADTQQKKKNEKNNKDSGKEIQFKKDSVRQGKKVTIVAEWALKFPTKQNKK